MAKLKINGVSLEAKLPEVQEEKHKHVMEVAKKVSSEHSELLAKLRLSEIDDKIDEVKLDIISVKSHIDKIENEKIGLIAKVSQMSKQSKDNTLSYMGLKAEIDELEDRLKEVSKPIVKEIKVASNPKEDLDSLEKDMKKAIDAVSRERRQENTNIAKKVIAMGRYQNLINFFMIGALVLLILK
jgi:DNA repair exonuclease SbcCD ATPase subunit